MSHYLMRAIKLYLISLTNIKFDKHEQKLTKVADWFKIKHIALISCKIKNKTLNEYE